MDKFGYRVTNGVTQEVTNVALLVYHCEVPGLEMVPKNILVWDKEM